MCNVSFDFAMLLLVIPQRSTERQQLCFQGLAVVEVLLRTISVACYDYTIGC